MYTTGIQLQLAIFCTEAHKVLSVIELCGFSINMFKNS